VAYCKTLSGTRLEWVEARKKKTRRQSFYALWAVENIQRFKPALIL